MKEEKRVQQEIENQRKKLAKDEAHFNQALEKYKTQFSEASDDILKRELLLKMEEIQGKINDIQDEIAEVDYRERNAKAGYVYIISNIGSFGENIYKIGMTRRLEPLDSVKRARGCFRPLQIRCPCNDLLR